MSLMLRNRIAFAAEDGSGGGAPAADAAPADGATILAGDAPAADAATEGGEDAGKVDEKKVDDVADPLDTVPEDGKYALTMPEGMEVDTKLLDALAPTFKELNLTTAQANKLAAVYAENRKAEAEAYVATPEGAWSAAAYEYFKENGSPDAWADQAKADPEIGGAKWDATVASSVDAVNRFGTPEFKKLLNSTGVGNHPEAIRFMAKVGAMIGEDKPAVSDGSGAAAVDDTASTMYPNDKPKGK